MKFEINRLAMLQAAQNMARVAPAKSPVEFLTGVLVEADEDTGDVLTTATNTESSIQQKNTASVETSGAMLVPARILVGMLSLLKGEYVSFESAGENALVVKGGRCIYKINCALAKSYPKPVIPFPEESVKISGIPSLAGRTVFAISQDNNKPVLLCVNVKLKQNAIHATACDGIRVMLAKNDAESSENREFLFPGRALQMLVSISDDDDVYDVGDTGREIVFTKENLLFSMRKIPGEYIDTNRLIQSIKPAYTAVTESKELKEALRLMSIDNDGTPVNLTMSNGQIHLNRNGDSDEANTTIIAAVSADTPESGFYYNVENLSKLFQVVSGRIRLEIDARGMMVVKTASEFYVQTPQRPPMKNKEAA